MTDYEHFIRTFEENKDKYKTGVLFEIPFISFKIGGGIGGSKSTCGMITFSKDYKFTGIMHSD